MDPELLAFLSKFPMLTGDLEAIAAQIPIRRFEKGEVLLRAGEICNTCYFILKGCVRQYYLMDGIEKTTAFFTEEQAVVSLTSYSSQVPVDHFVACVEDCTLMVGRLDLEKEMYDQFPVLETITRAMMTQDYGKTQDHLAAFITASPEKRYLHLLETRPELLDRVPQYQLASYLGITPESLSRIRRRVAQKN